jgi:predicted RNA-binding Zn-ribbon protein involved in translation (DUF1610 family)
MRLTAGCVAALEVLAQNSLTTMLNACLNCGESFGERGERRRRFCPECGQETNVRAPTMAEFAQQFGGAYFATEGALWRSLKLLLLKPGELTAQYLAGRRKHYVLPLRLYLTISLLALLLVRVVGIGSAEIKVGDAAEIAKENKHIIISISGGSAGMRDGVFFCENLPTWVCLRVQRRLDIDPKKMLSEVEFMKDRFLGNLGGAMFVLLPSFALWLKLVYRNRHLRYTEHLVFALHVHAFWFVALLFTLPNWGLLTALAALSVPVYTLMAMKRVYGGRLGPRLLRACLVSVLYGTTLALALAGVALVTFLF